MSAFACKRTWTKLFVDQTENTRYSKVNVNWTWSNAWFFSEKYPTVQASVEVFSTNGFS